MTQALKRFSPTRFAALEKLNRFVPRAGRDYASRRNFDLGRDGHLGVSTLSPYLRARIITEADVLEAVLSRHSTNAAEKFIQEIFWRTYWKGWLEMRPAVWTHYNLALKKQLNGIQTQSGLRANWQAACLGETEIDCFNAWANELVETGYLHNHARMWFASIWIFTLNLPWELGADFFLRHLLDGDPASNTLGWRWVAGIQTPGKTYLARTSNISKFTEGRFAPKWQLASKAEPITGLPLPPLQTLSEIADIPSEPRTGLLIHDDDLSPGYLFEAGLAPLATAVVTSRERLSPLAIAPHIESFAHRTAEDVVSRFADRLGNVSYLAASSDAVLEWARQEGLEQIVTSYAPVGPNADLISDISTVEKSPKIKQVRRQYDSLAWPFATHGFFRFKEKIPFLLSQLPALKDNSNGQLQPSNPQGNNA